MLVSSGMERDVRFFFTTKDAKDTKVRANNCEISILPVLTFVSFASFVVKNNARLAQPNIAFFAQDF